MTHFEYLSVLLSVVTGLALTRILGFWGELIRHRQTASLHWPHLTWTGVVFLMMIYGWWAAWGERDSTLEFTFFEYVANLVQPSLLVLVAWLLTPALPADRELELRAEFMAHTRWVFGLLALSNGFLLATEVETGGADFVSLGPPTALLGLATCLAASKSERVHRIGALAGLALVVAVFGLLDASPAAP